MSHTPHELHDEFPDDAEVLHNLKMTDARFKLVSEQYHGLNREIHRIESEVDHASDARLEMLKKQRLAMLDDVALMVTQAKAAA
ncbi:MAG: DUF465 domain-containing protein [Novosphingobium sp.]|nr:DUF465 domain-containing protein [Novosphingobium sp.]